MGKWRRSGLIAAILLVVVTGLLIYRGMHSRSALFEAWSVPIPGAGVYNHKQGFYNCRLYGDEAVIYYGSKSHPELIGLDGKVRWVFSPSMLPDPVVGESAMDLCVGENGWIYLGTDNNNIYAFDETQAFQWRRELSGDRIWCSHVTVTDNGTVYAASPGYLTALDPTGAVLWERENPDVTGTTPVYTNGTDRIYAISDNLEVIAFDTTGTELWRTGQCGIGLDEMQIAGDGTIVCPDNLRGVINAYRPDGSLRWQKQVTPPDTMFNDWTWVAVGPDDSVYYSELRIPRFTDIVCCDMAGQEQWRKTLSGTCSSPVPLPDGRVAVTADVGDTTGKLNELVLNYVNPHTGHLNMQVYLLDKHGQVRDKLKPDYLFFCEKPMVTGKGELLLIDFHGVMHAYQL